MIKALFLHPLGPSFILALGGFLLLPLRRTGNGARPRAARAAGSRVSGAEPWTSLLAFLVLATAGAALLMLRAGAQRPTRLEWAWQPLTVAGGTLSWRLDGWNWLAALLILCAAAAVLALLGEDEDAAAEAGSPGHALREARDDHVTRAARTLWLAAAAIAFVCSDNLVTLVGCWTALDATLALRLLPGRRAQPASRAWGGLSLAGLLALAALIFQGEANARTALSAGPFSQPVMALLWLAALARAGVYPLHLWLFGGDHVPAGDRLALHLFSPIAGIWLLARVQDAGPAWLHRPEWAALGALAMIGTALAAWAAPEPERAWRWVAVNRVSLVVLATYVAGTAGPSMLALCLVTVALGAGLLALGTALRLKWHWAAPAWLGALALWGLPGTPGFMARAALILPAGLDLPGPAVGAPLVSAGQPLFFLILIAETLLVAALWHAVGAATRQGTIAGQGNVKAQGTEAVPFPMHVQANGVNGAVAVAAPIVVEQAEPSASMTPEAVSISADVLRDAPAPAGTGVPAPAQTSPVEEATRQPVASYRKQGAFAPVPGWFARSASAVRAGAGQNGVHLATNGRSAPLVWLAGENRPVRGRPENDRPGWSLLPLAVVAALLAIPIIAWGLWPRQLAALAGLPPGSLPATLAEAVASTRRSVWVGLIIAGLAGSALGYLRPLVFAGMRGWQEGILAVVSLEWAYQVAGFALQVAGSGLRYFARLGEGEGYVGWLALAGLILWVLLRS